MKRFTESRVPLSSAVLLAAIVLALGNSVRAEEAKEYNFLVIMADDLGAAELASYGHDEHRTPHLDRLAEEGMRFRTCYATPLCTPSRVLIMTGRYGFRTGYFAFLGRTYAPKESSPEYDIGSKLTFADVLGDHGYATAAAGKWQLTGRVPTLVHDCGFDTYRIWTWLHELPGDTEHTGGWERPGKPARFWHPGILEDGRYLPTEPDDYGPDLYTDFLIDFMQRHRDQPFVAYYPMALTHTPWDPTPSLENPGERTDGGLRHNVEAMDRVVGRLVDALDEAGLREETIVIFTGDNGTKGAGKGRVTEMGARVPLIVSCPGTVPAGVISDELVDLSDIMPTLLQFADADLPAGHVIDGKSLAPTLRGEEGEHRPWVFSYLKDERMLRDDRWLLEGDGRLYDTGGRRDGVGYEDVTGSDDPEAVAARERFEEILEDLPGPEGHPGLIQPGDREKRGNRRGGEQRSEDRGQ